MACEYRQRLGLANQAHTSAQPDNSVRAELRQQIDAGSGKTASSSYVGCIEKYFLPYCGDKLLKELTYKEIREFQLWRDRQMLKKPHTSTLNNFTSAWSKIFPTAVERGFDGPSR